MASSSDLDSMVLNCTVAHNTGNGINTADNCTLENCIARENGEVGFDVDANSLVSRCTARANGTFGVSTDANCSVIGSVFHENGSHGLNAGLGNDDHRLRRASEHRHRHPRFGRRAGEQVLGEIQQRDWV